MVEWIILALIYGAARRYTHGFIGHSASKSDWETYDLCGEAKRDIINEQAFLIHLDDPNGSWEGAWIIQ